LRETLKKHNILPETIIEAGRIAKTKYGFTPSISDWWEAGLEKWCDGRISLLPKGWR
jgi:hypothetical protein